MREFVRIALFKFYAVYRKWLQGNRIASSIPQMISEDELIGHIEGLHWANLLLRDCKAASEPTRVGR